MIIVTVIICGFKNKSSENKKGKLLIYLGYIYILVACVIASILPQLVIDTAAIDLSARAIYPFASIIALSIVRFRTAIKETKDLLFLFWAITNGIIIGAGVYSIACVLAVVLTIGLLIFDRLPGNKKPYLLVVSFTDFETEDKISKFLADNKIKFRVKSRNATANKVDIIYELAGENVNDILKEVSALETVKASNLLTQDGECQF